MVLVSFLDCFGRPLGSLGRQRVAKGRARKGREEKRGKGMRKGGEGDAGDVNRQGGEGSPGLKGETSALGPASPQMGPKTTFSSSFTVV